MCAYAYVCACVKVVLAVTDIDSFARAGEDFALNKLEQRIRCARARAWVCVWSC